MGVAVVGHQTSTTTAALSNSFTFTVPASTNFLILAETGHLSTPASATPALYCTINGVGMQQLPGTFVQQTFSQCTLWYMPNPPTGSVTCVVQYNGTSNLQYMLHGLVAFSGVNTGDPFYTPGSTTSSGSSANRTVSTGISITSNDLYVGVYQALSTTSSSAGGQTNVFDFSTSDASLEQKMDTIPGSTANPTFSWTSTSNNGNTNNSIGIAVALQGSVANLVPGMNLGLPIATGTTMTGVVYKQTVTGWNGATTAVSGSVTATAGDYIIVWGGTLYSGDLITLSASIDGSYSYVGQQSSFAGGAANKYGQGYPIQTITNVASGMTAAWAQAVVSGSAQTYTITSPFGSTGVVGLAWEYANVGFVELFSYYIISPGTGAGAVTTGSVTVPDHGILLSLCVDNSQTTAGISSVGGTNRGTGSIQASSGGYPITYCATEFVGTGVPVTPAFTTTFGTDSYIIYNFLMHPKNTRSFSSGQVTTGMGTSASSAMSCFHAAALTALTNTGGVTLLGTQSFDQSQGTLFTTKSFDITVPVGTTCVVYFHGSADGSGGAYCTSCTLNGSAFTVVSGTQVDSGGTYFGSSIHYLFTPNIGTSTFVVNLATNVNAGGNSFYAPCFAYFKNVSSFGGGTTNASTSSSNSSVTVTGLSSNLDIYVATTATYASTGATQGANMVNIEQQQMTNGTVTSNCCSYILGSNSGAFAFTATGSVSNANTIAGCWIHH